MIFPKLDKTYLFVHRNNLEASSIPKNVKGKENLSHSQDQEMMVRVLVQKIEVGIFWSSKCNECFLGTLLPEKS